MPCFKCNNDKKNFRKQEKIGQNTKSFPISFEYTALYKFFFLNKKKQVGKKYKWMNEFFRISFTLTKPFLFKDALFIFCQTNNISIQSQTKKRNNLI